MIAIVGSGWPALWVAYSIFSLRWEHTYKGKGNHKFRPIKRCMLELKLNFFC